jgi:hypothetical protein
MLLDSSILDAPIVQQLPFVRSTPAKLLTAWLSHVSATTRSTKGPPSHTGDLLPKILSPKSNDTSDLGTTPEFGRLRAAKNDDAEIPYSYWDDAVWANWEHQEEVLVHAEVFIQQHQRSPLCYIRILALRRWRRNIWRSFRRFMSQAYDLKAWSSPPSGSLAQVEWRANCEAARDCIWRCNYADWWDWKCGSRLLFWRWPPETRIWARDGLPVFLTRCPSQYRRPQAREKDPNIREMVRAKLAKFIERGYIASGEVKGLISYFSVPKGEGDIRVVFDGTKSGLNDCIWMPGFALPTINSLLSAVEPGNWMDYIDIGEQFL